MRWGIRIPEKPNGAALAALLITHVTATVLTYMCTVTTLGEVVIWLPNAVLLAALLHFKGERAWTMAAITFASDFFIGAVRFTVVEGGFYGLTNLVEVAIAYQLMARFGASARLDNIASFGRFVVAGPLVAPIASSIAAALAIHFSGRVDLPVASLTLLWWYGDALGLLIVTPLLLAVLDPPETEPSTTAFDAVVVVATCGVAVLILSGLPTRIIGDVSPTPTALLPAVLFIAARYGPRGTALLVAALSIGTAWSQAAGHAPFGPGETHATVLRIQEFVVTLSIVGMGFALLLAEQRGHARVLEEHVRERTAALEETNRKLSRLSATDGLTGLANRRRFDQTLAEVCAVGRADGEPVAVALIDVDHFKAYNDTYGHLAGDDCLRRIAEDLAAAAQMHGGQAARFGGEEFAIVFSGLSGETAAMIAVDLCRDIRARADVHRASAFGVVTVSIGVAAAIGSAASPARLLERADAALYRAKSAGRSRVEIDRGAQPMLIVQA